MAWLKKLAIISVGFALSANSFAISTQADDISKANLDDWLSQNIVASSISASYGKFQLDYPKLNVYDRQDIEKMVATLKPNETNYLKKANQGDLDAQLNLINLYFFESQLQHKPVYSEKLWYWLTKSAENNLPNANMALGDSYLYGLMGVKKDMPTAIHYFENVSKSEDKFQRHLAIAQLASIYWHLSKFTNGTMPDDLPKAYTLAERLVKEGDLILGKGMLENIEDDMAKSQHK